jgi:hypothetical protein
VFAGLVAESRGIPVEDVLALEAEIFVGREALARKLVDGVCDFDELIASLEARKQEENSMNAIAALRAEAEGEDQEKAAKAKRALAAYEDEDKKDEAKAAESDEEKPEASAKAAAEDKDEDKEEKPKKDEAKALNHADARVRAKILASRPDLLDNSDIQAVCESLPTDRLAAFLAAIPKPVTPAVAVVAQVEKGSVTQGADAGSLGVASRQSDVADELDRRMGLKRATPQAVSFSRGVLTLGGSK